MDSVKTIIRRLVSFKMNGAGGMYVVLIFGLVSGLSYLLTGGLTPHIERKPENPQVVEIEDQLTLVAQQNLQMRNIVAKPTPTPTINPLTTPTPPACSQGVVVALVVDVSGSMGGRDIDGSSVTKLDNLKTALHQFVNSIPLNTTVTGLFPFATKTIEFVPFNYLSSNKQVMDQSISALTIADDNGNVQWLGQTYNIGGSTNMKDAFVTVGPKLLDAKNAFPNGQAYLVFMSDGVPENNTCQFNRTDGKYYVGTSNTPCEATIDTHPQNPVAASQALKDQGVKVFSVALYGERESAFFQEGVKKVMRETASDPESTYYLESPTSAELTQAFQAIVPRLCQ